MNVFIFVFCVFSIAHCIQSKEIPKNNPYGGKFKHFFVLMEENRSYEHMMMGVLQEQGKDPWKDWTNPLPDYVKTGGGSTRDLKPVMMSDDHEVWNTAHTYARMNTQIFETVKPEGNRFLAKEWDFKAPYNFVEGSTCTMKGFVEDFFNHFSKSYTDYVDEANWSKAMPYLDPKAIPVFSTLAKGFGVGSRWHCDIPTETYPNRAMVASAQSSGFISNKPDEKWAFVKEPTIYELLSKKGHSWKVYYPIEQGISASLVLGMGTLLPYFAHFVPYQQLERDLASGDLPDYAFLEPMLLFDNSDYHPGYHDGLNQTALQRGEVQLSELYLMIRNSSFADDIFLTVTFDENGGLWSTICPPSATPPFPHMSGTEMDFKFDRLGVRVPSLFISSYIDENVETDELLQHTSVMATLRHWLGFNETLTDRDASASPIPESIFNRDTPRKREEWPVTKPHPIQKIPEKVKNRIHASTKLNEDQKSFLKIIQTQLEHTLPTAGNPRTLELQRRLSEAQFDKFSVLDFREAIVEFKNVLQYEIVPKLQT